MKKISILLDFVRKGYTDQLKIGKYVNTGISSKKNMLEIINAVRICNKYYIIYNTELWCELYGTKFRIGSVQIVSGTFQIGKRGLKRRYKSFKTGDVRQVSYSANPDYKTYTILDSNKSDYSIKLDSSAEFIGVKKMNLNFGFIYENH